VATVRRQAVLPKAQAEALMRPRHGLLTEVASPLPPADDGPPGPLGVAFDQSIGPLASYHRTVQLEPAAADRAVVTQEVRFRVGLTWWSWLLYWPTRHTLGQLRSTRQPPWWGPPEPLDRRGAVAMSTAAALMAVLGFLGTLLPETLTYVASEYRVGTFGQGVVFAAVEMATIPSLAALVVADRRGRRPVVLVATGAAVVLSLVGAAAPGVASLGVLQVAANAMADGAAVAAGVLVVEEMPRRCRAWATGVLGMAFGGGGTFPLLLLPLAGTSPGGWRWLYLAALSCLPVVIICAGQLPESRRWVAPPQRVATAAGAPGPALAAGWGSPERRRLLLVGAGALLLALFATPAGSFQTHYLRHQVHDSAAAISTLQQITDTIGGLGVLLGGRLAETWGRRPVAAVCVAGGTAVTLAAYLSRGWSLWLWTQCSELLGYAVGPALGVFGFELFATARRARSAGLITVCSAVGGVVGLLVTGALSSQIGTLAPALAVLAVGPLVLTLLLVFAYPETAGHSLEELTASPAPPD
jgi:MFS family permease